MQVINFFSSCNCIKKNDPPPPLPSIDFFPEPTFITDNKGCILKVNQSALVVLKATADQLIGKNFSSFIRYGTLPEVRNSSEQTTTQQVRVWKRNASDFAADISLHPLRIHRNLYHVYTLKDRTEINQMIATLQQRFEFLAHETGNTDVIIESQLDSAKKALREGDIPSAQEHLTIAEHAATTAINYKNTLLGRRSTPSTFSPNYNFKIVVNSCLNAAEKKGLRLGFESNFSENTWLKGNVTTIGRALYNLISNAIKFTQTGEVKTVAFLKEEGESEFLVLSVVDTGPGIPDDKKELIFKPREQIESTRRLSQAGAFGGVGLGLSIIKKEISDLGGKVTLEDNPKGGSIFSIQVPVTQVEKNEIGLRLRRRSPPIPHVFKSNSIDLPSVILERMPPVLFVDDSPLLLKIVTNIVKKTLDCNIKTALNGNDAFQLFLKSHKNTSPFSAIVIDEYMPGISGLALTKKIREWEKAHNVIRKIPIIGLSATANVEQSTKDWKKAGADDFCYKSANEELTKKISALCHLDPPKRKEKVRYRAVPLRGVASTPRHYVHVSNPNSSDERDSFSSSDPEKE